jgi:5'-3' exonuclease
MSRILIIDTSFLIYKSHFSYQHLTYNEAPTGAFYGFARTILYLVKYYKPDRLVFALDTVEPTWRHLVYQQYKLGRPEPSPEMTEQIPVIINWCRAISANTFSAPGFEADDIIYTVASSLYRENSLHYTDEAQSKYEVDAQLDPLEHEFEITERELIKKRTQPQHEVFVYSTDRDLFQLFVYPEVQFIQHGNLQSAFSECTQDSFKKKYLLDPIQWLDYKALVGDNSDNLGGVPGIGPKTATKILQEVGSLYYLFEALGMEHKQFFKSARVNPNGLIQARQYIDNPKNAVLIKKLSEYHGHIAEIYHLSGLSLVPDIQLSKDTFDVSAGNDVFEEYGFQSLIKESLHISGKSLFQESLL